MQLVELQKEHAEWHKKNFSNTEAYQMLLGVMEEVGELAHAHLKREQGVRGTAEKHHALARDAVGDIVVFLAGYCTYMGYGLAECVEEVWNEVKTRDYTSQELKNE